MSRRQQEIGCNYPHGFYPFPASRAVCPDCQRIRMQASLRTGLPYRWWWNINWEVVMVCIVTALFCFMLTLTIGAWLFDWKG